VTPPPARPHAKRVQDTLHRLTHDVDAWVATAGPGATPYQVPLSFLWDGETLLLSTATTNPTSVNLLAHPAVRLALGGTRDVVLIEGTVEAATPAGAIPAEVGDAFAAKAGFDPRGASGSYHYFRVRPRSVQAWREVNELPGRDLMRDGRWL
jgi:hypothetical protein